jgi:hypothetical protein
MSERRPGDAGVTQAATPDYDPRYGVRRDPKEGCVIVRWSEMTDDERERAWRDYEKAFGAGDKKESK